MKQIILYFMAVFLTSSMFSQKYLINLESGDINNTLDSILIINLSSNDTLQLKSNIQLILTNGESAIENSVFDEQNIYPNPSFGELVVEQNTLLSHPAFISITDLSGRIVYMEQVKTMINDKIKISNIPKGIYLLSITSSENKFSELIISQSKINSWLGLTISYHSGIKLTASNVEKKSNLKSSTNSDTSMLYNEGERILLVGYAGNMQTIVSFIPTNDTTISFNFYECTDSDSNNYKVVEIGEQIWMAENLKYLPSVNQAADGSEDVTGSYYYVYGYDSTDANAAKATANYATYGVLYNWTAAMADSASSAANPSSVQGVCPAGWHLPSDAEWKELTDYLGGVNVAGGKLKETGTTHWAAHAYTNATNETGFTALPGGNRGGDGAFYLVGVHGTWWSATESSAKRAWYHIMGYDVREVFRDNTYYKDSGYSVRCVMD